MAFTTLSSSSASTTRREVEKAITSGRSDVKGVLFRAALFASLLFALLILALLLFEVAVDSRSVFTDRFGDFMSGSLSRFADRAGVAQGLLGSFWIAVSVVVLAVPLGISAAIYLEEYAPRNWFTNFIDLNIRNLAGVPSVVYGILGLTIFVEFFGMSSGPAGTLGAAGVTLAILVLPVVIITTAEAIRAVPVSLREGAFGVGATRWEVIRTQVLPYATPGILTGSLLSMARAVGEAAPLILLGAGTGFLRPSDGFLTDVTDVGLLNERFTAMPILITEWTKEPDAAFKVSNSSAAIIVLLVFVLMLNSVAIVLRNRLEKKR